MRYLRANARPIDPEIYLGRLVGMRALLPVPGDLLSVEDPEKDIAVSVELVATGMIIIAGRADEFSALCDEAGRPDIGQAVIDEIWSATARR